MYKSKKFTISLRDELELSTEQMLDGSINKFITLSFPVISFPDGSITIPFLSEKHPDYDKLQSERIPIMVIAKI